VTYRDLSPFFAGANTRLERQRAEMARFCFEAHEWMQS